MDPDMKEPISPALETLRATGTPMGAVGENASSAIEGIRPEGLTGGNPTPIGAVRKLWSNPGGLGSVNPLGGGLGEIEEPFA